jgi:hypothetical protein
MTFGYSRDDAANPSDIYRQGYFETYPFQVLDQRVLANSLKWVLKKEEALNQI